MTEYPDPDIAAYATSYPWIRDDSDPTSNYHERSIRFERLTAKQTPTPDDGSELTSEVDDLPLAVDDDSGSDYDTVVEDAESDEFMSDESFNDKSDAALPLIVPRMASNIAQDSRKTQERRVPDVTAKSGGRRVSSRKPVPKGTKRGLRKPLEPGMEFTAEFSQATVAFANGDYEKAELYTLKALQLNPEVFQAHNLLSEIHAARGDKEKAINAAWNGAHTRPRDTKMWARVAGLILEQEGEGRELRLKDALYCYARIITVDRHNIEARQRRAAINRELGYKRKVISEYEYLLRLFPQDITLIRHLADIYTEVNEADKALHHYESHTARACSEDDALGSILTWSDVNIIAELYIILGKFKEGLMKVRRLCRRLLGRQDDHIWDSVESDDREWDLDHEPRRSKTSGFVADAHGRAFYGEGLPMELRVKLGTFRLLSDGENLNEALMHYAWLEPEDQGPEAIVNDFSDLFREVALALKGNHQYEHALRYLLPLDHLSHHEEVSVLMDIAACHRSLGSLTKAEECYKAILDIDHGSTEARIALWNMTRKPYAHIAPTRRSETGLPTTDKSTASLGRKTFSNREPASGLETSTYLKGLRSPKHRNKVGRPEPSDASQHEVEVLTLFSRWKDLRSSSENIQSWFEATKLLLQAFCDNRVFFPADRSTRFYGYSREARMLARSRKVQDGLEQRSPSTFEGPDGDAIEIPKQYLGITFPDWLDIFLENAIALSKHGKIREAYASIKDAMSASVFYHSTDALLLIYVCWFTCALVANDEETLHDVSRWFIMRYQFVTDGYHLFAALHRLCDSDNDWFNSSPSQKYLLRQLKAVDFSFLREGKKKPLFQERASYTTKDSSGKPLLAEDLDVALLMLYGHILYAGKSYSHAINYFLRGLSLDPKNASIKLSLALAYVHWAIKRQAENRHHILAQGFAFLTEYYEQRSQVEGTSYEKQEAEYNVARMYHLLGLVDLAIPHYEICLQFGSQIIEEGGGESENFAYEAAFALQSHWATQGDFRRARDITHAWLVI